MKSGCRGMRCLTPLRACGQPASFSAITRTTLGQLAPAVFVGRQECIQRVMPQGASRSACYHVEVLLPLCALSPVGLSTTAASFSPLDV